MNPRFSLQIGANSRSTGGVSMDGRESHILHPGESVTAFASRYPVPCINRSSIASEDHTESSKAGPVGVGNEDDWVRDINSLLQYNATFRSKALLRRNKPASKCLNPSFSINSNIFLQYSTNKYNM